MLRGDVLTRALQACRLERNSLYYDLYCSMYMTLW